MKSASTTGMLKYLLEPETIYKAMISYIICSKRRWNAAKVAYIDHAIGPSNFERGQCSVSLKLQGILS